MRTILILFEIKVNQIIYLKRILLYNRAMQETNKNIGSITGGLVFSAVVVVYLILSLIFSIICSATGFSAQSQGVAGDAYVYISYLVAPLAVLISLPLVLRYRNVPLRSVLPVKMPPKKGALWCGVAVLLAFGLLFSLSWINTGFNELLKLLGYENGTTYFPELSGGGVVLALLVMAVMPALFEETLFRGVILQNARREAGDLNAVLLCGLCFSLFHASALQTFYQFLCGCAFALLAMRARSVLPCMVAHFLNNAAIVIFEASGLNTAQTIFDWVPLWAAVLVTVLSALSLAASVFIMLYPRQPFVKPQKGGVKNFFFAASAGIVVLVILWIAGLFS